MDTPLFIFIDVAYTLVLAPKPQFMLHYSIILNVMLKPFFKIIEERDTRVRALNSDECNKNLDIRLVAYTISPLNRQYYYYCYHRNQCKIIDRKRSVEKVFRMYPPTPALSIDLPGNVMTCLKMEKKFSSPPQRRG